jgi:hypothetical protein
MTQNHLGQPLCVGCLKPSPMWKLCDECHAWVKRLNERNGYDKEHLRVRQTGNAGDKP